MLSRGVFNLTWARSAAGGPPAAGSISYAACGRLTLGRTALLGQLLALCHSASWWWTAGSLGIEGFLSWGQCAARAAFPLHAQLLWASRLRRLQVMMTAGCLGVTSVKSCAQSASASLCCIALWRVCVVQPPVAVTLPQSMIHLCTAHVDFDWLRMNTVPISFSEKMPSKL